MSLFGDAWMHQEALRQLLQQEAHKPLVILGETFLHHLVVGEVDQVSREAPVPVVRVVYEETCPGGAGAVAAVVAALGGKPILLTVLGHGEQGQLLRRLLDEKGIDSSYAVSDPRERSTVKLRLFGKSPESIPQQMLRMEWNCLLEQRQVQIQRELLRRAKGFLEEGAVFLCAIEATSFLSPEDLAELVRSAKLRGAKAIVRGIPGVSWEFYRGADSVVSELSTALEILGARNIPPAELPDAIAPLLKSQEIGQLVIPIGQECLLWLRQGFPPRMLRAGAREGLLAYDHLVALLGVGAFVQSLGGDWELTWELLQLLRKVQTAAPTGFSHPGEGQLTRGAVLKILEQDQTPVSAKIVSLPELLHRAGELRKEGKQLVLAYGNFEILQPGHVASLEWARQLGDFLVVGVRSDRAIQLMKGGGKTNIPQSERAAMLAALECVDFVTVWEDPGIQTLVEKLRPDVVVNGIEWPPEQVLGWQIVQQYGGRIVTVPIGVRGGVGQRRYQVRAFGTPENRAGEGQEPAVIRFPRAA